MSEQAYERMSDRELEALTEEALRDHESGEVPFRPRGETARHTVGTVPISIRIPVSLLEGIKTAAAAQGIPYQRLMKRWLEEGLAHDAPKVIPQPVVVHLTPQDVERLHRSGLLDIQLAL